MPRVSVALPNGVHLAGKETVVRIGDLMVDRSYQRRTDMPRATRIANAFDWRAFTRPIVNRRRNGEQYVVDGFHRTTGAGIRYGADLKVPVIMFDGLTRKQEADLFLKMNEDRKAIPPATKFNAHCIEGDDEYLEMDRTLVAGGYNLREGLDRDGLARLTVPNDVIQLWRRGGPDLLVRTLRITEQAWPEFAVKERTGNRVLRGIGEYLHGVETGEFSKPHYRSMTRDAVTWTFLSTLTPKLLVQLGRAKKDGGGAGKGGIPLYIDEAIRDSDWRKRLKT